MRKAFSLLLALFLLAGCFGTLSLAAEDASQAYLFELTVGDSGGAAVSHGDEFTVKLTLTQTKPGTGTEYAIYAAQDEIFYDSTIFELVPYSGTELANVLAPKFGCSERTQSDGITKRLMFHFSSSEDGGDMYPTSMTIAEFKFKVIGAPTVGNIASITNRNQKMVAENPYNLYTTAVRDLTINFDDTGEPPVPTKYTINLTQPTGATIVSSPSGMAEAGKPVSLAAYLTAAYSGYTVAWSVKTTQGANIAVTTDTSSATASFTMPAADVTVSVTLMPGSGSGGGGGLVPDTGGGTPPSEMEILDNETPLTGMIFLDVPDSHWAHDYIYYLSERGFVNGKAFGVFAPADPITRAEFVTILSRMSGDVLPGAGTTPFTDVVKGSYYEQAVAWAYLTGITKGTSATEFSPNALITRQEMATMIVRYAAYKQYDFVKFNDAKDFTDSQSILSYAKEFVSIMQQADIISGYGDGSFKPFGNTTRAETAKMLALVYKLMTDAA